MWGRPVPKSTPESFWWKHANPRENNNKPPKRLLAGAPDNTQLFGCLKISKVFITRKIGVPAQGWKTPRTYYARRRAENTAKASQRRSPPRGQVTLGLTPMLLCRTEVTGRPGKLTHGLAPEHRYRWFDFHSDQIRVISMNLKFGRKLGYR